MKKEKEQTSCCVKCYLSKPIKYLLTCDCLYNKCLIRTVADCLKAGQPVPPETFDCATVYFSDVVGFTNICSRSTPVEVVAMLNLLYSKFDEIIVAFNAYKVLFNLTVLCDNHMKA